MSEKHFFEQKRHAEEYLVPYLERHVPGFHAARVLEVGCAEGGFLDALLERGVRASGLELEPGRISLARKLNPRLEIREGDITDPGIVRSLNGPFDLIVLRDVIEHVTDRESAFRNLSALTGPAGHCYITFPPRFSPFAGHHHNGRTLLRRIPYLHLLPPALMRLLGRTFGEHRHIVEGAVANRRDGLSIARFEALCASHGFEIAIKELYILRPVFRTRMGMRPLRLPDLPGIREFLALGCECLLRRSA
jgi:SAM-dependent methyltransferase